MELPEDLVATVRLLFEECREADEDVDDTTDAVLDALELLDAADMAADTAEAAAAELASDLESLHVLPRSSYILRSFGSNRWP